MKKLFYMLGFILMPGFILAQESYFAGTYAGFGNTGYFNTGVGEYAMEGSNSGHANSAFGHSSLNYNTTGAYNAAFGYSSLFRNTTGQYNTASGVYSLNTNVSGSSNSAFGYQALYFNGTGSKNTAMGELSLYLNASGSNNTAIGVNSLYTNTTGGSNTALGYASLRLNTVGILNVAIGNNSGFSQSSNLLCTFLGSSADATVNNLTNATAIGYNAKVNASNKVVVGSTAVTSIGGQVGWTTYSDKILKTNINKSTLGLNFILQLNPVTYNYTAEGQKDILYTGLIAQELDAAARKIGTICSAVDKSGEFWGIRYAELTVPLITSVQELNEKTIAVEKENQQLRNEIEKIQAVVVTLKEAVEKLQQNNKFTTSETKGSATMLFQNQPNPFSQATTISYQVQSTEKNAVIVFRNMNGSMIKQITIPQTGSGKIYLTAGELVAGTYTYSLLINNAVIDTKLMIVTK